MSLEPVYDATAAFSIGLGLRATYAPVIEGFLNMCESAKAPRSEWRKLEARYKDLLPHWEFRRDFDSWFRAAGQDMVRRVAAGDSPEAAQEEIKRRFDKKYGEPEVDS